jgi:hypothetical protein
VSWYQTTRLGSKNSPGATSNSSSAERETAKHHAAKSGAHRAVDGQGEGDGGARVEPRRSGAHQPGSVSTSSFMTTA